MHACKSLKASEILCVQAATLQHCEAYFDVMTSQCVWSSQLNLQCLDTELASPLVFSAKFSLALTTILTTTRQCDTSEPRRHTAEMYASAAKNAFELTMTLTFDL